MVLGGVPIWTLTHSQTVGWSQMRNSRHQMRRSREIRLQLLNISAPFFPLPSTPAPPPPPSPSSLPVSIPHSATHLRRSSRFRGWLSSTAVAQRSCLTVQLLKKKNCWLLEGVTLHPELLERLRQSVAPPCHGRCLLMTWQRCHNSKVTRANLGVPLNMSRSCFRREARRKLLGFFPPHPTDFIFEFGFSSKLSICHFCRVFSMAGMAPKRRTRPKEDTTAC